MYEFKNETDTERVQIIFLFLVSFTLPRTNVNFRIWINIVLVATEPAIKNIIDCRNEMSVSNIP